MTDTAPHPDYSAIEAFAATGNGDQAIGEHIKACLTCNTLAMAFTARADVHIVDPDRYADKRPFRRGGMGRTFTAHDTRIGRDVILKEPAEADRASLAGASLRMERRLLRERKILGLLEHPAIVPIYETGRWPDGTPFFAMRKINGPTLAECIADADSFSDRIVLLPKLLTIIDAVGHAHQRGVVHRDLSPDNMMIGEHGEPYVIDWGIATLLDEADEVLLDTVEPVDDGLTRGGVGKEPYASREQRQGEDPNPGFDVYSLGVTLHHLLLGRMPFRHRSGLLEPLPRECPDELASIVRRATASDRAARFADAGELATELRRYQQGKLVEAHRYTLTARLRRFLRRHRLTVSWAVAVILTTAALWSANVWRKQSEASSTQAAEARAAAQIASAEREAARERAVEASSKRDEAMENWERATERARNLTHELEDQRRLSRQQVEQLTAAIEAERTAAREAMELRSAAEDARHEAEAAALRAQRARAEALEEVRSAREAKWAAENRAAEAVTRAAEAKRKAAQSEATATAASAVAADAEARAAEAETRAAEADAKAGQAGARLQAAEARARKAASRAATLEKELARLRKTMRATATANDEIEVPVDETPDAKDKSPAPSPPR